MHKLDRFVLTLGRPSHGWLPFRLELGNFVVDDAASAVLNDPVEELLDLLAYSASPNQTDARVCFWLEPAGYALDASFIATGALLSSRIERKLAKADPRFTLRVFFDEAFVPPMRRHTMDLRFEAEMTGTSFFSGLRDGLATLLLSPEAMALDEWHHDRKHQWYLARFETLRRSQAAG